MKNDSLAIALNTATQALLDAQLSDPAQEARWLLAAHLNCDVSYLWQVDMQEALPEPELFAARLKARAQHKPLSRIMGRRAFWKHNFQISEAVLDPRADSEWLLEGAKILLDTPPRTILDLGTGSGALLLSALDEWPNAHGLGIDTSKTALQIAHNNAERFHLGSRVSWHQGHWLNSIQQTFDLILCNPPYIPKDHPISPAVRYDPQEALFSDNAGLADWQEILGSLVRVMHPESLCLGECAPNQTHTLANYASMHSLRSYSIINSHGSGLVPHQQIGIIAFQTV